MKMKVIFYHKYRKQAMISAVYSKLDYVIY